MSTSVLFISPFADDAKVISQMLQSQHVALRHVRDVQHARLALETGPSDVVLTEAEIGDGSWLDVLRMIRETNPGAEVIVTHPFADARFWAEAINLGAYDIIAQPFYESEVQRIIGNACSRYAPERTAGAALYL
ncbi:MAG: response regulator [Bryobacteraceae bacterium]